MKAAAFTYERPHDIASAIRALTDPDGTTKIMAGGQSLGPMLNLRLAEPSRIVDLTAIGELKQADTSGGDLVLGACITHADVEDGRVSDVTGGAMQRIASNIAYRAVRNRGTIGGSLCHADPSADWVSALMAFGAALVLRGPSGPRAIALQDFVRGALETALQPGEIVETIRVPRRATSARWGYVKSCRKTGEFAHALAAALIDPDAGSARIVIGAIDGRPIVVTDPDVLFGGRIDGSYRDRFDARAADRLLAEAGVDNPTHRHIHLSVLKRAISEAA